jgi:hypothetical protein
LDANQAYGVNLSATRKTETERRQLGEKCDRLADEVIQLESAMNITRRWQPMDSEYMKTLDYLARRNYEQALDNLQRLVIMRLYELQKMNLSQTGMLIHRDWTYR